MDYDREKLAEDDNPIALVVFAAQEKERLCQSGNRYDAKWYLIRRLYERGYSREEIFGLFQFIDWVLQLSGEEETRSWKDIKTLEGGNKMPYITSVERIGMEQGLQQGLQQMVVESLNNRFGDISTLISDAIHQIGDQDRLRELHRWAIRSALLEEFQQVLSGN